MAAAPSGLFLKLVEKSPKLTSFPGETLGVSLVSNTQHRMSLPDRGGLQGQSALEPVAFYVRDSEQKLLDVLGRHPLPSAAPALALGTSHPTAMLRSLLCSRAEYK